MLLLLLILCTSTAVRLPLLGNYSETFFWFTTIEVDGVRFTVTVDTGSSDLLLPELGCATCFGGDPNKYLNVSGRLIGCNGGASDLHCNCSSGGRCEFSVTYGGALTEDAVAVSAQVALQPNASAWSAPVKFGATYRVTQGQRSVMARQSMPNYPEGICGLAFSELNALGTKTLLDTLADAQGLPNVFAMCFEEVGGMMMVGEEPAGLYDWAPVSKPGFWQLGFQDIQANGVSLGATPIFNTPGIVDSGTPFFTLPALAFAKLKQLLLANCSAAPLVGICDVPSNATLFDGACFDLTAQDKSAFPVLTVIFEGGARLDVTPNMYLIPMYQCTQGGAGLAIVPDPSFTVIGGNVLLHYTSVYDKQKMRVGFRQSSGDCSKF